MLETVIVFEEEPQTLPCIPLRYSEPEAGPGFLSDRCGLPIAGVLAVHDVAVTQKDLNLGIFGGDSSDQPSPSPFEDSGGPSKVSPDNVPMAPETSVDPLSRHSSQIGTQMYTAQSSDHNFTRGGKSDSQLL